MLRILAVRKRTKFVNAGIYGSLGEDEKALIAGVSGGLDTVNLAAASIAFGQMYKNALTDADIAAGNSAAVRGSGISVQNIKFGSSVKSTQKLSNQMKNRGWSEQLIRETVDTPYTVRQSVNKATGNQAIVYYNKNGAYVIIDNMTKEVVQISDNINPSTWIPDSSIINPYIPD